MRNTEKAEMFFRDMKAWALRTNSGCHPCIMVDLGDGMISTSSAIRDIYDKLGAMERKIDAIIVGVRDQSVHR